jgi:hypothetical protein
MCVFCASIPAVLALGTGVNAHQKRAKRAVETGDYSLKIKQPPVMELTIGLSAGILICSIIYHTLQ